MAKTNWKMDDTVMPEDLNALGQEINELKADGNVTTPRLANKAVTTAKIADGAVGTTQLANTSVSTAKLVDKAVTKAKLADDVTVGGADDTMIGDRTVSDATSPTSNTGKLTNLLSGLANMIKSITGGATWRTAPGMTIAAIKSILDAATNATIANTMIKRDANGRAKVAAPSATDDIARKAEVDAAITTAASDATTKANSAQSAAITAAASDATSKANAVQSNLNTHTGDNTVHITSTERTTWNAKETTTGAQTKANAAQSAAISAAASDATSKANAVQSNLNTHAADTTKHITAGERTVWNGKASKDGTLQADLNVEMLNGTRRYNGLSELGITLGSETVAGIFSAMKDLSEFHMSIGSGANMAQYPIDFGNLKVYRYNSVRGYAEFHHNGIASGVQIWDGIINQQQGWSGWVKRANNNGVLQTNLNADMVDGSHSSTQSVANTVVVRDSSAGITANKITAVNPDSVGANVTLEFKDNIPRIRIGGSGDGILNGFEIQSQADVALFKVNNAKQIVSQSQQGTSPFVVNSTTVVSNLNADLLDGQHGSYYAPKDSPSLTGAPTAPTAPSSAADSVIANTYWTKARIDEAEARAKKPLISSKAATDAPSTYPDGVSMFSIADDTRWPVTYAIIETVKDGNNRAYQMIYSTQGQVNKVMFRAQTTTTSDVWGKWDEFTVANSPNFSGTPTAPTAAITVNNTQLATTGHVTNKLNDRVPMKIFNSLTTPVGASSGDLWFPPL